jgi:hypothetical protein
LTDYTKLIEKVARQLHDGTLKPSDLNSDLLTTILNDVRGAVADGYGKEFNNYTKSPEKKIHLNQNLYRFSAAKTYQELAKINLARQNNPNFSDFKKEALKVNKEYNIQYLQTEFDTANRSGAMAEKWNKIQSQKHLYPNLTYKTANDNHVREEHRNLQNITKPVDDSFWDKWYPPNGWHCRCYVTQTDGETTPGTPEGNPTPGFHGNVGKNNMVFNENEHPYFVFPAEDVTKIQSNFEYMKLSEPDYTVVHSKNKASLQISTWADPSDLEVNINRATILVNELGVSIKIRPHVRIDKFKNPELLIDGVVGDLAVRKSDDLRKFVSNTFDTKLGKKGQLRETTKCFIVFDFENATFDNQQISEVSRQLWSKFGAYKKVNELYLINDNKAVKIDRETIKEGFNSFKTKVEVIKNSKSKA